MPPMALLILIGPQLFEFVFGQEWLMSGKFAQWMSIWLLIVFAVSPLGMVAVIIGKQKQAMFFETILLISRIASIVAGARYGDVVFTVMLFSVSSAICWLGYLIWIMHNSGNNWTNIIAPFIKSSLHTLMILSPIIVVLFVQLDYWVLGLILALPLIGMKYFLLLKEAYKIGV